MLAAFLTLRSLLGLPLTAWLLPSRTAALPRRDVVGGSLLLPFLLADDASAAATDEQRQAMRAQLLRLVPSTPFGAPATNVTLSLAQASEIEAAAERLEALSPYPRGLAQNPEAIRLLNGSWRLVYTNAPEITTLAKLPLGFELGEVYQPVDTQEFILENQASIKHSLGLASGNTRVVSDCSPGAPGTTNAAGIVNTDMNRVDVDFKRVVFQLDRVLGVDDAKAGVLRKVVVPTPNPSGAQPAVDITYLDSDLRITRGGDAALFVLCREASPTPMLRGEDRARLIRESEVVAEPVASGDEFLGWLKRAVRGR